MIEITKVAQKLDEYAAQKTLPSKRSTEMFHNIFSDAIKNATEKGPDDTYFVATGDIPAMWLRDATFQVLPYLEVLDKIPELKEIILGVLKLELRYVQHDPYANAFNQTASGAHWSDDETDIAVSDLVWERKFEIDSLCAPIFLALKYHQKTGETALFDDEFWQTVALIMDTFETEQHHETSPYYFKRVDCPATDTLVNDGRGTPIGYTGMIWCGFRPSDDACEYGYHVPSNMYAISVLRPLLTLIPADLVDLKQRIERLIAAVEQGIKDFAIVTLENGQQIYAYEVDGLGNVNLMDDANVPSLLSLPFLGYLTSDDELYQATRQFILSAQNPYYYSGKILEGIGSSHTPERYVWPVSLAMEGLTTPDVLVKAAKLQAIAMSDNQTKQCHESVQVDDPTQYTREWFSWSNMTFCQLALEICK